MNNVNAPAHLADYAAGNGIDLIAYYEALDGLVAKHAFIEPEPPFANDVLLRLRMGRSIDEAIAEARDRALSAIDKKPH